jgi:hypothetical protein
MTSRTPLLSGEILADASTLLRGLADKRLLEL